MTKTKKDIVLKIYEDTGLKQMDVRNVVQRTFDFILDSLSHGEKVEIRNFGVFKLKKRRPKIGRNPHTGERVDVPARTVAYFKPGLQMKPYKMGEKK
ncbi:Histone-like bacterial DNA-binding protein [Candidatus Omnitrophus magneticus]|uniref:Histone-like bacterial DNA-binding protein n=1 Tax=Candidatus Omnitrophus magneticus TaxID=1609969 RepID=A0A0F0CNA9_9BACT|nr:Histone-like bacterial DNA-binding protein [Candidatus Omnitrophus magneticus]